MNTGLRKSNRDGIPVSDRAVIFVFFLAGAAAAFFGSADLSIFPDPRLFFCSLMAGVLLLSASTVGCILLPLCSLLLGSFTEQTARLWAAASPVESQLDLRALVPGMILVPVFFLASTHGMTVSAAVQNALQRGSPTARTVFRRELALVFVFVLLAFAAIFYFY